MADATLPGDSALQETARHLATTRGDRLAAVLARPEAQAFAITASFVAIRLIAAAFSGLGVDESYTVSISHEWNLSYFDHPPLHQWLVYGFGELFGWGPWLRLPFIALSGVTSWLMFALGRRLFGATAGVWATLAFNLAVFFTVAAGSWILPDGPLNLCLAAAALALCRVLSPDAAPSGWSAWSGWIGAGVWIGLAGLSKYQAALFCVGVLLFLLTVRGRRRWFAHPAPYVAAVLTLLILSPVLIWNAEHAWVSILFQSGRGAATHGLRPLQVLSALAGQAVLLSPWVFVPAVVAAWSALRAGPEDSKRWLCLMMAAPAIVAFTVTPLWGDQSLPHWSMPGWLLIMPLLGDFLSRNADTKRWPSRWAQGSVAVLALLWLLATVETATGALGKLNLKLKNDPTVESVAWTGLRAQVSRRQALGAHCLFIAALNWNEAGKIGQAVGDLAPVRVISPDPRGFGYLRHPSDLTGCDALVIAQSSKVADRLDGLRPYFASIRPFAIDHEGRNAREIELTVLDARGLLRGLPAAYAGDVRR